MHARIEQQLTLALDKFHKLFKTQQVMPLIFHTVVNATKYFKHRTQQNMFKVNSVHLMKNFSRYALVPLLGTITYKGPAVM